MKKAKMPTNSHRAWVVVGMVLLGLVSGGCGAKGRGYNGPTGTVTGKVTLNGKPIEKGSIAFINENLSINAVGLLKSDGTYALKVGTSFSVPVGDYRIAVTGSDPSAPIPDPNDLMSHPEKFKENDTIPPKFRDPNSSGLIAVVKEGSNLNVDFDLK